jgi:hypothetical protein
MVMVQKQVSEDKHNKALKKVQDEAQVKVEDEVQDEVEINIKMIIYQN